MFESCQQGVDPTPGVLTAGCACAADMLSLLRAAVTGWRGIQWPCQPHQERTRCLCDVLARRCSAVERLMWSNNGSRSLNTVNMLSHLSTWLSSRLTRNPERTFTCLHDRHEAHFMQQGCQCCPENSFSASG